MHSPQRRRSVWSLTSSSRTPRSKRVGANPCRPTATVAPASISSASKPQTAGLVPQQVHALSNSRTPCPSAGQERFRAYDSPASSFRDYVALLRDNPRYESAHLARAPILRHSHRRCRMLATPPIRHTRANSPPSPDRPAVSHPHTQDRGPPADNHSNDHALRRDAWPTFFPPAFQACSPSTERSIPPATTSRTSPPRATAASGR